MKPATGELILNPRDLLPEDILLGLHTSGSSYSITMPCRVLNIVPYTTSTPGSTLIEYFVKEQQWAGWLRNEDLFRVRRGAPVLDTSNRFPHICARCGAPAYLGFTESQCSRGGICT